jgi:hypothetical protein
MRAVAFRLSPRETTRSSSGPSICVFRAYVSDDLCEKRATPNHIIGTILRGLFDSMVAKGEMVLA